MHRESCYNFDKLKFKEYFAKVNWDGFCHNTNPNNALVHFIKVINKLLDNHAPYKTIKY